MTKPTYNMKKNIILSIFSGLLLWLAWPPMHYTTVLLFFGLVPMLVAIENIIKSTSTHKGKRIFSITFLGFFVWNTLSVYWVYNSLKTIVAGYSDTYFAYSLFVRAIAYGYCLAGCIISFRLAANRSWGLAGLVCFWIAYEYLHQTWDLNFPWMTLGNGFAVTHQWIQWYEYTGVYGGTIWIWALNILVFLIYTGFSEAQTKPARQQLVTALINALVLPVGFSLYRYCSYKEQPDPC